ncbi:hypothetical protein SOVF_200860 [Spinacia oleracea]|nr:hypothetical protein SOVF_200860 [Spinacia oleracea]
MCASNHVLHDQTAECKPAAIAEKRSSTKQQIKE